MLVPHHSSAGVNRASLERGFSKGPTSRIDAGGCGVLVGCGEPFGEEPYGEDELEKATWDHSKQACALRHVDHVEHVEHGSDQQHGIADDAENGDPSWDQPCPIQEIREDQSGHAGEQIHHHNGHIVLRLKQRAQMLGCRLINGAVGQSVTNGDDEEWSRQVDEDRCELGDSEPDVPMCERFTVVFQQGIQEDGDTHDRKPVDKGEQRAGGEGCGVGGASTK